ncbi:MAG: hypothetical protein J6B48_00165 [Clostridia bacterium]|nr:hypothetical protein [Clostridia bacterium]
MYYEDRWLAIRDRINERGADGSKVVEALQDYYSVFEDKALTWLGSLFDPDIGGFYYSESARDNEFINYNGVNYPLLPDIESTSQATNFLQRNEIFKTWMDFPRWMIDKMAKFICERQDPETGFFYHPQWPKEFTDSKPSRRGRDLQWAISMAEKYEFKLPYPTAYERLENQKSEVDNNMPEYLKSEEKFLAYLKSFDWENKAYWSGNQLAAQVLMIKAAGLGKVVVDFLNSIQNPSTGTWGKFTDGFGAINGYLKISAVYQGVGLPIPNSEKALPIAFDCTTAPTEDAHSVCFQYNAWFSVCNILSNVRDFYGASANDMIEKAIRYHLDNCIEPIISTKEKALVFKKPAGCFSMAPNESSGTSQGMPVAIFYTNEGDINANGICSSGTARFMFEALGLEDIWVPIFSPEGKNVFMSALKLPKEMK